MNLLNHLNDGIIVMRKSGELLEANAAAARLLGCSRKELLSRTVYELLPPPASGRPAVRKAYRLLSKRSTTRCTFQRRDGSSVVLTCTTMRLRSGDMLLVLTPGRSARSDNQAFHQLQALVEHASDGILVQVDGCFVYVNGAAVRLFGAHRPNQLIGTPILDRVHPDHRDLVRERTLLTTVHKQIVPPAELVYVRLDGSLVAVESTSAPMTFGGKAGSVVFVRSVEERQKREQAVRVSEERLKKAQAVAHVGNWELDLDTRTMWGSEEAFRIYGLDRATEWLPLPVVQKMVLPAYRPVLDTALQDLIHARTSYDVEFQVRREDTGQVRFLHSRAELVRDVNGTPRKVVGVVQDITDRKEAEAALVESENRWRTVFDNSGIGIVLIDEEGFSVRSNLAFREMIGYTEAELAARPFVSLSHPQDAEKDLLLTREIRDGLRDRYQVEKRYFRKSGEMLWANQTMSVIRSSEGSIQLTVALVEDITDRKLREHTLKESEFFLLKSQSVARVGSYYFDAKGGGWTSSPVLDEIFGISAGDTKTVESWLALIHPDDREAMQEYLLRDVLAGHRRFDRVYRILRKDDAEERWVHGLGELEFDEYGQTLSMIGTIQDVTERIRHEQTIVTTLQEKEILLKEIHHRVKNNMQVISSLLSLQRNSLADPAVKGILLESMNRIRSMALVHEKSYKARDLGRIDFRDYLQSLVAELSRSFLREDIAVRIDVESVEVGVDVAIPCGLIANELISNAFKHAFPDGRQGSIAVVFRRADVHLAELTVLDDGIGMPERVESEEEQTLGLTIIHALTSQLSGTLTILHTHGTEVKVQFPL
jgi:PAS domain S-box-containing protein